MADAEGIVTGQRRRSRRNAGQRSRELFRPTGGDNVHVIDPVTNRVVGTITGIEANHGVAVAPDGSRIYVSNEAGARDVATATFRSSPIFPLSGHPNNIAVGKDGRRVRRLFRHLAAWTSSTRRP